VYGPESRRRLAVLTRRLAQQGRLGAVRGVKIALGLSFHRNSCFAVNSQRVPGMDDMRLALVSPLRGRK
jgi:hypothetical protein